MTKSILAAAAMTAATMAAAVSAAALSSSAFAMTVAPRFAAATETAGRAQQTAVFCGPLGCGHIWRSRRHHEWGWRPWGPAYRPACPTGYYYACRRGPLGYGQCACWPYRRW